MFNDDYVKIVYQTPPIGERKIILYLTTFDLEAYKKDHKVKYKKEIKEIPVVNYIEEPRTYGQLCIQEGQQAFLEYEINHWVKSYYQPLIEQLRYECEKMKPVPICYGETSGNVANVDEVHCNDIKGNVVNCDKVYCNTIKGNVINCEVIYKGE